MKRLKNHGLLLLTLICAMLFSSIPVEAKTVTMPAQTATLYASSDTQYDHIAKKYISKNENLTYFADQDLFPSTIKSSKNAVAAPGRKITLSFAKDGYNLKVTYAYLKVKKKGTTVISDTGTTTYKYKLAVKKYTNPFSSLTINGTEIKSNFKKKSVYTLSYAKYKNRRITFNFAAKDNWYITAQSRVAGSLNAADAKNGSSVTVSQKGYTLKFFAENRKTGQTETCEIIWK